MVKLIARLLFLAFIAGGTANLAQAQGRLDFLKHLPKEMKLGELGPRHRDLYHRLIDVLVEPDEFHNLIREMSGGLELEWLRGMFGDTLQRRKERMILFLNLNRDVHVDFLRVRVNRLPPLLPALLQIDAQPPHLPIVTQRELNAANCMTGAQLVRHLNGIMEETQGGHHDNNGVAEGNGVDNTSLQLIRTIIAELPGPTTNVVAALLMFAVRSKQIGK